MDVVMKVMMQMLVLALRSTRIIVVLAHDEAPGIAVEVEAEFGSCCCLQQFAESLAELGRLHLFAQKLRREGHNCARI